MPNEAVVVNLPRPEWDAAYSLGLKREALRRDQNRSQDLQAGTRSGGDSDRRNGVGAVAEYALAKHYGAAILADWVQTKAFVLSNHHLITSDVGRNLQVRATEGKRFGLPLQTFDTDHEGNPWILAYVDESALTVTFAGWITLAEGRQPHNWRSDWPRPAYCVPAQALHPMSTIREEDIRL